MKSIEMKINIAAGKQKVWDTMLSPGTYKIWAGVSWPDSYFEGKWEKGEKLRFISPGGGGTLAEITEHKPYELITARHIAVINGDGSEDRDSEVAKNWIGSTETYRFTEKDGVTELSTSINVPKEWEDMINEGWPKALAKLKEICEN